MIKVTIEDSESTVTVENKSAGPGLEGYIEAVRQALLGIGFGEESVSSYLDRE